jgi:hypothetical protein
LDVSVVLGGLTGLTARNFDALYLRTLAVQVLEVLIAIVDQEACKVRESKGIHVKDFDTLMSVFLVRILSVWETLAAHHYRATPPCCIQTLGRSKQGRIAARVFAQKAIIVKHLHGIAKVHVRPAVLESLDRRPRDMFGVFDEVSRPHGLATIATVSYRRPKELRFHVSWEEDDDFAHVGSWARCGTEGLKNFAHALMHKPVSLLTLG